MVLAEDLVAALTEGTMARAGERNMILSLRDS
jgi:hypothetical protein